jgi:anaerobic selenocysteine-containing dehydrogenase
MSVQKHTFCRICEPHCPLLAEVDDAGNVVKLSPDFSHPSRSIACHKGLWYHEVHNDPDRVNWPLRRLNPRSQPRGQFVETDWDSSMADIGERLRNIRHVRGSNAIAAYFGNPWYFNAAAMMMGGAFLDLIGTDMRFTANTQDSASRVTVNCEVYGSAGALMLPDLYHTHYLLCLGANPMVSRWLGASIPNDGLDVVKQIVQRGGKVRFVNPRKVESSTTETGPTVQIRPGTDVYFLAAVLNEIEKQDGFNRSHLQQYGRNVDGLRAFIHRFPAERVAGVTGIGEEVIKQIAREIREAPSAAVYTGTGINQSRQGVLACWLSDMINFCTGNLGRKGGTYKPIGFLDGFPPRGPTKKIPTSVGVLEVPDPIGFAALPGAVLADLIENGDIKALVVYAGNPLLSIGGESRLRKAFEKLDVLVAIDIYRSATGELADYVLPATDALERMDINLLANGGQPVPYVQFTEAVVPPAHGRRNAWWILARLAQAMGLESELNEHPDREDGTDIIDGLLSARGLSIEQLRAAPSQTVVFEDGARDSLFERCLQHPDKKIDCCPQTFSEAGLFERCEAIFSELEQEGIDTLKLISLRTPYIQNSWFSNLPSFRRGMRATSPLFMCEADAATRGLHTGDAVRVFTTAGSIETALVVSEEVRAGTVAMSHGFGHQNSFGLRVAARWPGANYNALLQTGTDAYEPLSHMSWMTGVPVEVEKSRRWLASAADGTGTAGGI